VNQLKKFLKNVFTRYTMLQFIIKSSKGTSNRILENKTLKRFLLDKNLMVYNLIKVKDGGKHYDKHKS